MGGIEVRRRGRKGTTILIESIAPPAACTANDEDELCEAASYQCRCV